MLSKKLKRWSIALLAALMVVNIALIAAAPKVRADTMDTYRSKTGYYDTNKIRGQVLDHQLYYFLVQCFRQINMDKTPTHEVKDWRWLERWGANEGTAVRGAMYDARTADCNNGKYIGEAFKTLGFDDPVKTFCSLSFTYNKATGGNGKKVNGGNNTESCITGVNDGEDSDGVDGNDWKSTQTKAVANLLQTTSQGKAASKPLSDEAEYIRYLETLVNGCQIRLVEKISASTKVSGDVYKIPIVKQDGTIDYWRGTRIVSSGSAIGEKGNDVPLVATTGSSWAKDITCGDLEKALPTYAAAYSKYCQTSCKEDSSSNNTSLTGSDGEVDDVCLEGVGKINPLSWVGCSVLSILNEVLEWADGMVHGLLFVKPGTSDAVKASWTVFRNLAYIVLIPAMLIMVIGTAVNIGPFDPYTVKKALPRMFAAVLFITLSFPICAFFVNVSNIVGNGAGNLILNFAPGGGVTLDGIDGAGGLTGALFTGGVLYGLAGSISWGIVGSLGLVMAVGVLIGLIILIMRQILIILLIALAPLAILVWIFPGNDKLWNIWKTTFIAMLMMYPLISLLIASGQFFAATIDEAGPVAGTGFLDGPVNTLVALLAYVAPFFLIPATFKYGLGVFGNLAGMINDRSRGFFDRQRKFRENSRAASRQRAREGKRFQGGNDRNWRGGLNRGIGRTMNAGAIVQDGNLFRPGQWSASTRRGLRTTQAASIERTMKEDADYATWKGNDTLNRAASETNNAAELRSHLVNNFGYREGSQQLDDAVNQAENMRRKMSPEAFRQMTTLQAIAGGTAFEGSGEVARAIGRATGNDDSARAWLVAQARSAAKNAGRPDHADMGFNDLYNEAGQWTQMMNNNVDITDPTLVQASTDRLADRVWESTGGASVVHSSVKPRATEQLASAANRSIRRAVQNGSPRDAVQSFASLAATHDSLSSSSPEKARIWADTVMSQDVDIASLSPEMQEILAPTISSPALLPDGRADPSGAPRTTLTFHEAIEGLRTNEAFQEMRREYGNRLAEAASRPVGDGAMPPNPSVGPGA